MDQAPRHTETEFSTTWQACGACWGQRVVFVTRADGELAPCVCGHCLGIGERLVTVAA